MVERSCSDCASRRMGLGKQNHRREAAVVERRGQGWELLSQAAEIASLKTEAAFENDGVRLTAPRSKSDLSLEAHLVFVIVAIAACHTRAHAIEPANGPRACAAYGAVHFADIDVRPAGRRYAAR